jgi:hypothetical protein
VFNLVFALLANKWYQSLVRDSIEKKLGFKSLRRRRYSSPHASRVRRFGGLLCTSSSGALLPRKPRRSLIRINFRLLFRVDVGSSHLQKPAPAGVVAAVQVLASCRAAAAGCCRSSTEIDKIHQRLFSLGYFF